MAERIDIDELAHDCDWYARRSQDKNLSPDVVLGLIDRIRELEAVLRGIARCSDEEGYPDHEAQITALLEKGAVRRG